MEKQSNQGKKLVIIGGGPAGYTAAIYASRAGLAPLLFEGAQPGGQLTTTTMVENYPGFPLGILGPEMMQAFREQALRFGTTLVGETVTALDLASYPYGVISGKGERIDAYAIIIATGSQPRWLGLPAEERLKGRGVSSCAICDGFFYKNKVVGVVGGGDSAAEEALYLAGICKKVYMFVRRDQMRASKIMQERVLAHPNIHIFWSTEITEILGQKEVEGICVVNKAKKTMQKIEVEGIFIAIGHVPNSSLLAGKVKLDEQGYVVTEKDSTKTTLPGLFAAGDLQDKVFRQAITAAGTGCMAALEAEKYLSHIVLSKG